jgi:hypothetical protein
VTDFYRKGLGMQELGKFKDHAGYSGVILGMPDESYHLEFTEHLDGASCTAPGKDHLLVFYFADKIERDKIVGKLFEMGYPEVEAENPYWKSDGITIEDPEGWRIVLMGIKSFNGK